MTWHISCTGFYDTCPSSFTKDLHWWTIENNKIRKKEKEKEERINLASHMNSGL